MGEARIVDQFLREGSEEAFRRLYRQHTPYLWALALRTCGGRRSEAEDALQEAWIRAAERLAEFQGRSALRTWLAGIVFNCCREVLRRRTPQLTETPAATASNSPDQRLDLERLVATLPQGQREVLALYHLEGFTHDEIAALLDIAPGTSKSRLFEARRALRRHLEASPGESP
ncbi:MAG: sigma-70 family RNA polymerase sigma factor [Acidobacteriota bacterium]